MFFHQVSQAIDLLGMIKFEDNELNLTLPCDLAFFIFELSQFTQFPQLKNRFIQIYDSNENQKLTHRQLIGLSVIKSKTTSSLSSVNPEFILTLKKAANVYIKTLASGWKLLTDTSDNYFVIDNPKTKVIKNLFEGMLGSHLVLKNIASRRGLSNHIKVYGRCSGDFILGKLKHLKLFSQILREEALGIENPPLSLFHITLRSVCDNLATHQADPNWQYLSEGVLEGISEEAPFCIT